ncbi:MAG: Unknown protein [uncultured Sulfurovum sp.]|uniref:Uncharacterized protein n=1 Tax=uncultured Sulfurovum sp. TaxID=269237 RepID=A0A6S6SFL9_9BACT|nr:MAG: Unknown protein [uncultured Sulfurovum sp.]
MVIEVEEGSMRELILVSISALLGYIVFSAFSTSETTEEAFSKIVDQPYENRLVSQEVAFNKAHNKHEEELIALENERKHNELQVYENIMIKDKENATKLKIKELDNDLNHKIAVLNVESNAEETNKSSAIYIISILLLFLLLYIYLRYKKQLNQIELDKQERYNEMMAKKEYAEKILQHISEGNLSFETERKLLTVLDELNGKTINPRKEEDIYHPNPDIIQLSNSKKRKEY